MENRCQRCDRVLSDPNAVFGWRCAEILGVSGELSKMGADIFRKFVEGVTKAQKLFGNSNFEFTDEQWKKLYSAFAKMSLWDGVDEKKVKEARKEGYQAISTTKTKSQGFSDVLKEYKEYTDKYGLISGVSKKLAKEGKLDDVTNNVLKSYYGIQNWYANSPSSQSVMNYIDNKNVDLSSYKNGYINDQNTGAVSKLKFGTTTMDNNGCEIIAAYNAMKTLGNQKDIRDIAYYFENDGQMLKGEFGTNPYANKRYFEKEGYKVKVIEGEKITEEELPKADAYIVSFWNSNDVMDALHTVAMRKTKKGEYELFNYDVWSEKSKVVSNLREEFLDEGIVPLSVHCVSK
ncbi:MAG: hypothetical protein IKB93_11660 [Clostridia bacterium]|nr:hypothetical protein [Clostridia bacterium]